jgi:hypothetical protein
VKALTALSVVLAALELHSPVGMSWGLILLPAALQGVVNFVKLYRQKRELDNLIAMIEQNKGKED